LLSLLIRYLQQHRCLLILDNAESILQSGERAGQYREGFAGYGELLRRIGEYLTPELPVVNQPRETQRCKLTGREKLAQFDRVS
jgi:hypothetical protein